jgi:outer membrane protein OmpA-like peptidoglycan-associated protein
MLHKNASVSDIHYMQNWQVSDSAARLALSTSISSNDIGKVAFQADNKSFYILQDTTGTGQWLAMGGGAGGGGPTISGGTNSQSTGTINFSNSNGVSFGLDTNGVMTASITPAGGAQTGISGVIAGTQTLTQGTLSFINSNGISFGLNSGASTSQLTASHNGITSQTVQTQGSVLINGSSGQISLSNANNITFGFNASTITASASFNQTVQTQSVIQQVIAGTQTKNSGSLSFANSNGISFGMSGTNTITASYTVPNTAGLLSAINISGGTTSNNLSALTFSNSNNISFGLNGSILTGSASFAQTAQTGISGAALSNTTYTSGTLSFRDGNGVSFASTTGQGISLTHDLQFTSNTSNITALAFPSAQTTKFAGSGTTTAGTNASISMTMNSNGLNLAVSVNNAGAANAAAISLSGNSTSGGGGYSNITSGTAIFAGGNNITLSQDGSRITISGANVGGAQTGISGISAGTTQATVGTVSFANSNGVSFGMNGNTMTASVAAAGGAQTGISSIVVSNTTYTSGQISFSQGNGISFGSGAGQAISITHDLQFTSNTSNITSNAFATANSSLLQATSATSNITSNALHSSASRVFNIVAATNNTGGGVSSLSSNVSFSNANGLSFYTSAGGAIIGSYTVPTQSVQTQNMVSVNGSTGNISLQNGNNITFGFNASTITASASFNQTVQTQNSVLVQGSSGAISFANGNGITFGGNASTITASHNGLTTGRASNDGVGLNTAQTNVTWTVNSSGISFNAAGYAGTGTTFNGTNASASMTFNSNGLRLDLSAAAGGGGGGAFSAGISTSGNTSGTTGLANAQLVFVGGNNVTLSQITGAGGSNTLVVSAANSLPQGAIAAGTQTAFTGTLVFSNSNNISFGMSNNSVITASVNIAATGALSTWDNGAWYNTVSATHGVKGISTASAHFYPFLIEKNIAFNCLQVVGSLSFATSTVSGQASITHNFGIYSNNANTLSLISSNSYSIGVTNSGVSATISYPASTNSAGYTYSSTSASATLQLQSSFGNIGYRKTAFVFGNTMSLTPGIYWLGFHQRQSTSSANIGLASALIALSSANGVIGIGEIGRASSNIGTMLSGFMQPYLGFGVYTSTGSAGHSGTNIPQSAFLSGISAFVLSQFPYITLGSTT